MTWESFAQSYDTWEPAAHIIDKRMINKFHASVDVNIDLQQVLHELRKQVGMRMMKIKNPQSNVEVSVPLAAFAPIAYALLRRATCPPSRSGDEPLKLEIFKTARGTTTQLQLDEPEDIAWLLQLHLLKPDGAYGCAIMKKGHGSNHNMTIMGAPFLLSYYEPAQKNGIFRPGHAFSVAGNVWVFNGSTGALLPAPGLPNLTMHASLAEYLKGVLRGRARWGMTHPLTGIWAELPADRFELTAEEAMPKARVKRARAGPSTGGKRPPKLANIDA